jgi:hypothetical protein
MHKHGLRNIAAIGEQNGLAGECKFLHIYSMFA